MITNYVNLKEVLKNTPEFTDKNWILGSVEVTNISPDVNYFRDNIKSIVNHTHWAPEGQSSPLRYLEFTRYKDFWGDKIKDGYIDMEGLENPHGWAYHPTPDTTERIWFDYAEIRFGNEISHSVSKDKELDNALPLNKLHIVYKGNHIGDKKTDYNPIEHFFTSIDSQRMSNYTYPYYLVLYKKLADNKYEMDRAHFINIDEAVQMSTDTTGQFDVTTVIMDGDYIIKKFNLPEDEYYVGAINLPVWICYSYTNYFLDNYSNPYGKTDYHDVEVTTPTWKTFTKKLSNTQIIPTTEQAIDDPIYTELLRRFIERHIKSRNTYFLSYDSDEDYEEVLQDRLLELYNTVRTTAGTYVPRIKYQIDNMNKVTDSIKQIQRVKFNDTPQNNMNYSGDNYTSTITTTESEVQLGFLSNKLDEMRKALYDIYDQWIDREFRHLFIYLY